MSILGNGLKGNILSGLAIGIGAAIVAPVVVPVLASAVKPLLKAVIKSGIIIYEKGREKASEAVEMVEDIVAEAKAELAETQKDLHSSATPGEDVSA